MNINQSPISRKKIKRKNTRSRVCITGPIYRKREIYVKYQLPNVCATMSRARCFVFDVLRGKIPVNFSFFDGFSGFGTMGIEAISRGASKVVFYDININSIRNIHYNLKKMTGIDCFTNVIRGSLLKPIKGYTMDVVYLDPPYECAKKILQDVILKLIDRGWINEDTIIVCETSYRERIDFSDVFNVFKRKKISNSLIQFLRYQKS